MTEEKYHDPDQTLYDWWMELAESDFGLMSPKMKEYGGSQRGSADLEIMGYCLVVLLNERTFNHESAVRRMVAQGMTEGDATRAVQVVDEEVAEARISLDVAQEIAVWLYMAGKLGRLVSDYRQGRSGKEDTWLDLDTYATMGRRILERGMWP